MRGIAANGNEAGSFPLQRVLAELQVTQLELARRTGIKATYINRLARGKCNPNWRTVVVIARALDLFLGDFHAIEVCGSDDGED